MMHPLLYFCKRIQIKKLVFELKLRKNFRMLGVKYCEKNSCLSKIQTRFAMQFKTRAQATGKCLLLHEILQLLLFAIECYVTN